MKETTIGQTSGNGQEIRSEATSNCQLSIVHCQLEEPFAAIDFETANGKRSSICSVGIVLVERGQIVDSIYQLIRPYPDYYTHWTTEVHGLTKRDTADAPDSSLIPPTASIAPAASRAASIPTCRTTGWRPLRSIAVAMCICTTTRWPTPKRAPSSPSG